MKRITSEICSGIGIAAAATMVMALLGVNANACAEGYTFSPNTTISSSQVNENFQLLTQAMPGIKIANGTADFTLSTEWQNVASITVTPRKDGTFLLLGNARVEMHQSAITDGSNTWSLGVDLCITETSSGGSGSCNGTANVLQHMPASGSLTIGSLIPAVIVGTASAVKDVPTTFYLTAKEGSQLVRKGYGVIGSSNLTALFLPASLP